MYEVSKCAPQEALRDPNRAYKHFYRKLKQQGQFRGKVDFPTFKKKSKAIGSFRLTGSIKVFSDAVQLPRIGRVRLHERGYIPTAAKILNATVSEQAGSWYVSVQKAQWHGTHLVTIDRFYPSSKTCSACQWVDEDLSLSDRTFICEQCSMVLDRDLNAAINIRRVAVSSTDTVNACGQESAGSCIRESETSLVEARTTGDVWAVSHLSML